ncbi:HEAT repeat domain-containing protein [Ruminococcus sp.]|uniref:HEAT repeat domain-containing protein n=1 Tax=Ruminococcus sp. TaxID=41978 RepID=UPI0025F3C8E2|nr:HEAT repeat domain-containing protein [Ruminococcus sp.]
MFSFLKRKKSDSPSAADFIVHTDKADEKKLPTISKDRITISINELLDGKYTNAQLLLENFFYVNAQLQKTIAQSLQQTLKSLSAKKWYTFSDECRGSKYYSHSNYLMIQGVSKADLTREKYPNLSDEEYSALLCIGSFHYNGYFREECLRKLADFNGHLRYFYIRVNDWVKEIRDASAELLNELLPKCPLYDIIRDTSILEMLFFTHRRSEKHINELLSVICARIKNELTDKHIWQLFDEEPYVRNSFYRFGCQNNLFNKEIIEYIIEHEPFGSSKERILMHKFNEFGCSESEYERYIRHKCSNVRYSVMLKKYEELNNAWDGLESMLTDKSSKVRFLAAFIMKKYKSFDPRKFFLGLLGTENTSTALAELGTYGTKADAETVKSFITSDNISIARIALHSYGKLMAADGSDTYWQYLCSDDLRMSTEAFRIISSNRIFFNTDRIWNEYQLRSCSPNGKYFIYLLCNQTDWERMKYLIKLYADDNLDKTLKSKISFSLHRRNMYKKLSTENASELTSVINENKEKLGMLYDELLFDISTAR